MKNIPKLRFPEFANDVEWEEKEFSNLIDIVDGDRGVNYPKSDEFFDLEYCLFLNAKNVTKNGFVFNEMQFITKDKDDLLRKGKLNKYDVVLTTRGSVGNFAFFSDKTPYENMRINSGMVILRTKSNEISANFLFNYCNSNLITKTIEDVSFGNAQQQLTVAEIKKFKLIYPKELQEQQKIADCLSSVDSLILAQSQKVELLKEHKKGLLQNLFPQDGEEVPKLRFPEFKNAPKWDVVPLEKIGEITTGKTPSTSDETLWNGSIKFITPTDIDGDIKYQHNTSRTVVKQSSMKILKVGTIAYTCIASIGKIAITTVPSITNQQINSITVYENINNEFVYYALLELTPYIKSKLANTTLPIINKTEFSKFEIKLPKPKEQQKIANFLSSIDELITSSTKKVETLKEHKKALMQKLFPSVKES